MNILIVSDAWHPQINGVVRTYAQVIPKLEEAGHAVTVISPADYKTVPLLVYSEVQLSYGHLFNIAKRIQELKPDRIHIATEGPLGLSAARYLRKHQIAYTSSYHTKFPEYAWEKAWIPRVISRRYLKEIHSASSLIFVPSKSLAEELKQDGFEQVVVWDTGIDRSVFMLVQSVTGAQLESIALYVGRVSSEKNLEAFLSLDIFEHKLVVGDGPQRRYYESKYPEVTFVGYKTGVELASYYQRADVLVFPSRTDTLGMTMVEAMACGTPVAAFDVTGPRDVVVNGINGFLGPDLKENIAHCRSLDRDTVAGSVDKYSWERSAKHFLRNLVPTT